MAGVKNQSNGYGYKYNNLADLDRAGVPIPKMRVKPTEYGEFVEYYDEEDKEWHIGAKVVEFEMKGCNKAQSYGASLSYARRYTTMLANKIACDDDDAIEKAKPTPQTKQSDFAKPYTPTSNKKLDFKAVQEKIETLNDAQELQDYKLELAKEFPNMSFKQKEILKSIFSEVRF